MDNFIDYSYALGFLRRFNTLISRHQELRQEFVRQGWNLLQSYQAAIFADIKVWSKEKSLEALRPKASLVLSIKTFIFSLIVITISLISALYALVVRKRILVFSVDKIDGEWANDFRLSTLYRTLKAEKSSYIEILHTLGNRATLKNFFIRKRPVIYLEAIDMFLTPLILIKRRHTRKLISKFHPSGFEGQELPFVKLELEKYLSATLISRARLVVFNVFFRLSGVRLVLSIDDPRHYNEIMVTAEHNGVASYALQHGHFTKYHAGWLKETDLPGKVMRPAHLIVWSQYWKQELLRLGTYFDSGQIVVGGERWLLPWSSSQTKRDNLGVLIPYEKDAPKAEIRNYIERLLAIPGVEVIFKVRADQDKQLQLEEYDLLPLSRRITVVRSTEEVNPRITLAMGTYSTFLYDMVVEGRPVAILETSIDYGEGMVKNGLASFVKKTDDLKKVLEDASKLSIEELTARRNRLVDKDGQRLEDTLRELITKYENTH